MKKKVCTKCGLEKSLEEFYNDCTTKDGKKFKCKLCSLAARKLYKPSLSAIKRRRKVDRENNLSQFLVRAARARAKNNDLSFDIGRSDIFIPNTCPVLGIELKHGIGGICDNSPTLDRINPKLGYVKGNIQVISNKANRMKNDATEEELLLFAKWINNYYGTQTVPTRTT